MWEVILCFCFFGGRTGSVAACSSPYPHLPGLIKVPFAKGLRPLVIPVGDGKQQPISSDRQIDKGFLQISHCGSNAPNEPWGRIVLNDPTAEFWVSPYEKRPSPQRGVANTQRGMPKGERLGRLSGSTRCSREQWVENTDQGRGLVRPTVCIKRMLGCSCIPLLRPLRHTACGRTPFPGVGGFLSSISHPAFPSCPQGLFYSSHSHHIL